MNIWPRDEREEKAFHWLLIVVSTGWLGYLTAPLVGFAIVTLWALASVWDRFVRPVVMPESELTDAQIEERAFARAFVTTDGDREARRLRERVDRLERALAEVVKGAKK